jgi:arylsulfatase A-like enzyme
MSDNGPVTDDWIHWYEVNDYGSTGGFRGRKHFLFEGGIRVPAIISQPGRLPEGVISATVFTGTDWLATLGGLIGFDVPHDRAIDSRDVSALWLDNDRQDSRPIHWALPTPNQWDHVIREDQMKLILDHEHQPVALFDLGSDPLEMFNLMQSLPEVTESLTAKHRAFMQDIENDPLRPRSLEEAAGQKTD